MNLKTQAYRTIASLFGIRQLQDFRSVTAAEILAVQGIGKSFLNKLRLYLAHNNIALRHDNPPAYWLQALTPPEDPAEARGVCPFTIVIDVNETLPFQFAEIYDSDNHAVSVPITRRAMWSIGLADYSIDGLEGLIQIERKGEDLPSSLGGRREEFESEIRRLSEGCEFAAVVVEHPWRDFLQDIHEHGARARAIFRTVLQWQIDYPGVHWWFCEGRAHAEQVTFRLLEKFWWQHQRQLADQAWQARLDKIFS
jgi:hypothetical protein